VSVIPIGVGDGGAGGHLLFPTPLEIKFGHWQIRSPATFFGSGFEFSEENGPGLDPVCMVS